MTENKMTESKRRIFPARSDIYQEDGAVVLSMEMPGVTKENLSIRVDNDRLIIDGRKFMPPVKGEYRLREIRDGDYHLEYTIDDTIDRDKIDATARNGIVTLKLGIKESQKPRKITVNMK